MKQQGGSVMSGLPHHCFRSRRGKADDVDCLVTSSSTTKGHASAVQILLFLICKLKVMSIVPISVLL